MRSRGGHEVKRRTCGQEVGMRSYGGHEVVMT